MKTDNNRFTIEVSKKDLIWSYLAQFFSIATGLLLLPLILTFLNQSEVGVYYILMSVGTLVSLVDFGFSPQFGRNLTYVFSGAKQLLKHGTCSNNNNSTSEIDYKLMLVLIKSAKGLFYKLGIIVFVTMITVGLWYFYYVTHGLTLVKNGLLIWIVFTLYITFQIYFSYYNSFLTGSGKITESRKTIVYSNLIKIIISIILLYNGLGLLGIAIANLTQPIVTKVIAGKYFFTSELKSRLCGYVVTKSEIKETINILWFNSFKMGICSLSGYLTYGSSTLLMGFFLNLNEIATYGLMVQLVSLIASLASIYFNAYLPRLTALKFQNQMNQYISESSWVSIVYLFTFIVGLTFLLVSGPYIIKIIGSETVLPSTLMVLLYGLIRLFDGNYWNFCQLIMTDNIFPFLKSALITASLIIIGTAVTLSMGYGLWGIVLLTGLFQFVFNNWFWPLHVLKLNRIKLEAYISNGIQFGKAEVKKWCF